MSLAKVTQKESKGSRASQEERWTNVGLLPCPLPQSSFFSVEGGGLCRNPHGSPWALNQTLRTPELNPSGPLGPLSPNVRGPLGA